MKTWRRCLIIVVVSLLIIGSCAAIYLYLTHDDRYFTKITKLEGRERQAALYDYLDIHKDGKHAKQVKDEIRKSLFVKFNLFKNGELKPNNEVEQVAQLNWCLSYSTNFDDTDFTILPKEVDDSGIIGNIGDQLYCKNIVCEFLSFKKTIYKQDLFNPNPTSLKDLETGKYEEIPAYNFTCTITNAGDKDFYYDQSFFCIYENDKLVSGYNYSSDPFFSKTEQRVIKPHQKITFTLTMRADNFSKQNHPIAVFQIVDYIGESTHELTQAGPFFCYFDQEIKP